MITTITSILITTTIPSITSQLVGMGGLVGMLVII